MKKIPLLLTLATAMAFSFTAVAADSDKDDTPLAKEMSAMNKTFRTLKKQVADEAKKDDNVALIEKIKKHIATAKDLEPATTKDVAADKKAEFLDKYKHEMDELAKTYDSLEESIKAGTADESKKILEKLNDEKKEGHKNFKADDDK